MTSGCTGAQEHDICLKKGRRGVEYGKLSIWHHWTRIKFRWNQTCSVIRGLFTNEVLKIPEILQAGMFRVWFGLVMLRLSLLLGLDPFWDKNFVPISQTTPLYQTKPVDFWLFYRFWKTSFANNPPNWTCLISSFMDTWSWSSDVICLTWQFHTSAPFVGRRGGQIWQQNLYNKSV